jgi:hypothetical protein
VPPTLSSEDGKRSSFQNIAIFGTLDSGQSPKTQYSQKELFIIEVTKLFVSVGMI